VAKCADSLTGKAFKFYTTVVSMELKKWKLDKFFVELFNYCFPPDFRLRQRSKMNAFEQKKMCVSEYAAELLVMFHTIGSLMKRERVEKLWNGLRPELQQVLWRENLEPQHSTWKQVLRVAERHEIADRIFLNDRRSIGDGSGGTRHRNNCQRNYNSERKEKDSPGDVQDFERQSPSGTSSPSDSESLGSDLDKHMSSDSDNSGVGGQPIYQKRSGLTKSQKDELRAEGRCFRCQEKGHISLRCPKRPTADPNLKALEAKSFGVQVAADCERSSRVLSSSPEELYLVSSAAAHFEEFSSIYVVDGDDSDSYSISIEANYIGLDENEESESGVGPESDYMIHEPMETGTVKLPKALINMSRLMMPMFIDVRGLFVSCQDLGDTKGFS